MILVYDRDKVNDYKRSLLFFQRINQKDDRYMNWFEKKKNVAAFQTLQ